MTFIETSSVCGLDIYNLQGNVTIMVHDKKEVLIETNDEDKIEFNLRGRNLEIKTKINKETKVSSIFSNIFNDVSINVSGNNINIINGQVVSSSFNNHKIDMKIFVPKNQIETVSATGSIAVSIIDISNELNIDSSGQTSFDIKGVYTLSADVSGQSGLKARDVGEFFINASGQSDIRVVGENFKVVKVDISGQSDVDIVSKSIEKLEAELSGQSDLSVTGKVVSKSVDRSGQSEVKFKN